MRKNHIIAGMGEVGMALLDVLLKKKQHVWGIDMKEYPPYPEQVEVLHICYGYSEGFNKSVKAYQKRFKPKLTIVHASVPVGTCDKLGVVHSPVRGIHPRLSKSIETFEKYFGGKQSAVASSIFRKMGIKTLGVPKASWTEALKLWDTTQYGFMIAIEKYIWNWCRLNNVPFSIIYQHANRTYNEGYVKMGRPDVVRPFLKHMPGPIGGHCIIPNAKLLNDKMGKVLIEINETYKRK